MTTRNIHLGKTGLALAVSAALLAGCGGGGGGPDPIDVPADIRTVAASAGSDLSADNVEAFAGPLARVVMVSTGNSLVSTFAGERESPAAVKARPGVPAQGVLGLGIGAWTARLKAMRERPAATETMVEPCPYGGSLTVTGDDRDGNDELSAGDVVSMTADQCVVDMGAPVMSGSFSMSINQVELDSNGDAAAIDTDCTMSSLSIGDLGTMDGSMRLRMRMDSAIDQRARLEYRGVVARIGPETFTLDVDIYSVASMSGHDHTISGGIGIGGQTFQVVPTSNAPFRVDGSGEIPVSGSLRLVDAVGDGLLVRAKAGGLIDFEFYPSGLTAPSVTLLNRAWNEYRP